eukprot:415962-Hanusia_phi.AAC.1
MQGGGAEKDQARAGGGGAEGQDEVPPVEGRGPVSPELLGEHPRGVCGAAGARDGGERLCAAVAERCWGPAGEEHPGGRQFDPVRAGRDQPEVQGGGGRTAPAAQL